jgi:hypothetical protein
MKCAKIRYKTKLDARIALTLLKAAEHGEQRYYRCPLCWGFHLTSQGKDRNR